MESIKRYIKIFFTEHGDPIKFYAILIVLIIVIVQSLNTIVKNKNNKDNKIVVNSIKVESIDDKEIIKRINSEIDGSEYQLNKQYYNKENEKKLNEILNNAHEIIEVINEIDNSNYLKDENDKNTSLLQQYELPTVEVVYILNFD